MTFLKSFIREEEGQDMVEYALLLAFITIAAVVAIGAIGKSVSSYFAKTSAALT